ncbi:MAG: hypothetical protein JKY94_10430 [Rhodobacteraceae bacterium]|nr:hypothetical protein [Paracoccaceae bacterium]
MTPLDQSITLAPAPAWEPQPLRPVAVVDPEPVSPHASIPKGVKERLGPFIGSGRSQQSVADELGCSLSAISKALKRMGVAL